MQTLILYDIEAIPDTQFSLFTYSKPLLPRVTAQMSPYIDSFNAWS
jgi:hypothetical protein